LQSLHLQHLHSEHWQAAHWQHLQAAFPADGLVLAFLFTVVLLFILKSPEKSGQLPQDTRSGFTLWEGQQKNTPSLKFHASSTL
jgi:hypothetical protein